MSAGVKYEAVIGLEVHAQMLTESKIFCGCSTKFGSGANSQTCQVCIGMPGVLPVLNKKVLEFVARTGIALGCSISSDSRFARKNYFYPDLPKGYQISQFELPICGPGHLDINTEQGKKRIGITRIHMEEDAGKNIHEERGSYSFVDLNRAGVPLMEIVSEPDIRSPKEASEYLRKLRAILRHLGVCDGNMEQGSLRCDANVSVRQQGLSALGTKVELKNMNSFKFVEKALEYEIKRQTSVVLEGGKIVQETRLFDSATGVTHSMRTKEEAHDYRYFPEPDLVPITINSEWLEGLKDSMPELPDAMTARFVEMYCLPEYDSEFLTSEKVYALWFEQAVSTGGNPKSVSNWMMGEMTRLINDRGVQFEDMKISPKDLCGLLSLIEKDAINIKMAKAVFEEMFDTGKTADVIVSEKGLVQITDIGEIEDAVDKVLSGYAAEVERYRAGEEKLFGFFVGQVMKLTRGKANPKAVNDALMSRLKKD